MSLQLTLDNRFSPDGLDDTRDALPRPCPFCGSLERLDVQFRRAQNINRRGQYDCSIYCRRCYAYGPRVRSEDVGLQIDDADSPRVTVQDIMKAEAIRAWNRRYDGN